MLMWGVGLFVAGQASVLATTYAGQALMDGCLRVRLPAMTRVTLSRLISIGPAVAVAIWTVTVIPTLTLTRALTLTLTLTLPLPLPLRRRPPWRWPRRCSSCSGSTPSRRGSRPWTCRRRHN